MPVGVFLHIEIQLLNRIFILNCDSSVWRCVVGCGGVWWGVYDSVCVYLCVRVCVRACVCVYAGGVWEARKGGGSEGLC